MSPHDGPVRGPGAYPPEMTAAMSRLTQEEKVQVNMTGAALLGLEYALSDFPRFERWMAEAGEARGMSRVTPPSFETVMRGAQLYWETVLRTIQRELAGSGKVTRADLKAGWAAYVEAAQPPPGPESP